VEPEQLRCTGLLNGPFFARFTDFSLFLLTSDPFFFVVVAAPSFPVPHRVPLLCCASLSAIHIYTRTQFSIVSCKR